MVRAVLGPWVVALVTDARGATKCLVAWAKSTAMPDISMPDEKWTTTLVHSHSSRCGIFVSTKFPATGGIMPPEQELTGDESWADEARGVFTTGFIGPIPASYILDEEGLATTILVDMSV